MKIFTALVFFFFASACFGQSKSAKHSITITDSTSVIRVSFTTFNHAERISNGATTYLLTESFIKVTKSFFGDTTSKTVYLRPIKNKQTLTSTINKVELDSLEDDYFNNCVMTTSGDEYFLDFENNSKKKSISLHHYYLKQLDEIIQIINFNLPKKYQFQYLKKDTKQDCSL